MDQLQLNDILDSFYNLKNDIEAIKNSIDKISIATNDYQSRQINELATSLAKAQGEYNVVSYNRENPYFKSSYIDLDGLMKAVRHALAKNGLSFIQQTRITDDGATMLHSILMHSSGQWIESRNRIIPPKNDQQTYGSTLTYQKRYAAMSLLGITVSHDASDDDAEVAMANAKDIIAKGPSNKYNPRDQSSEVITKEQLEELEYELAEFPDIAEMVLDKLQLQSLSDMPKNKYMVSVTRIREIKNLRNGVK